MEDEMELHMQMEGAPVTLRLKKNDHVRNDVPVYTSERRNVELWDTEKMPVSTYCLILKKINLHSPDSTSRKIYQF